MKSKVIRLLLIAAAMLLMLQTVACAKPSDNTPDVTTAAPGNETAAETAAPETTSQFIDDDLPDDLKYDNTVCRILYWKDAENQEYFAEAISGELVNDAIYERNMEVENRLGINFDYVGENGNYNNMAGFLNHINNTYKVGERAYDIASSYSLGIALLTYNGLCSTLQDSEYIDFDKPWWSDSLLEQATINDKLYFVSGDLSTNMLYMMYVTYFNKDMLTAFGLESPYELVEQNKWTLDKMIEMGSGVYEDLNTNGKVDEDDRLATLTSALHSEAYFWGCGIRTVDRDSDGNLIVSPLYSSERAIDVINKLASYFNDSGFALLGGLPRESFNAGRTLFHTDRADVGVSDITSGMEYGIVPVCKYDSDQTDYYTVLGNPFSLYCIPADAKDIEMSGAVIECLCSEGYRTITPALFETTMKIKYTYDDQASQMYDIIRESTCYDLGRLFTSQLGGTFISQYRGAVAANNNTWASSAKTATKTVGKSLEKLQKNVGGE